MQSQGDNVSYKSQSQDAVVPTSKVENTTGENLTRSNTSFHNVRYMIIVLCGLATGTMFFTRLSVTVAMLSMVNHTHLYLAERPNSTIEDFFDSSYVEVGQFNWSNEIQQMIIAGYMIAYTLPQVMTTRISMKYGIRLSITVSLLVCAASCLMTPVFAYWGWEWILALRLLNGLGGSALIPCAIGAIENWMPDKDSAAGLSLLQFVQTFILVGTPLLTGELASIHWEWAFYVPGIGTVVFALLWWSVVRDTPASCSYISQRELDTIKGKDDDETNSSSNNKDPTEVKKKPRRTDLPWHFMFKFRSFYWFILLWILYCCTFGGMLFLLPSYFNKVLKMSVKENGFYNFIIQLGVMFSMLWPNPIIAWLQNQFKLSLTCARRIIVLIYTSMTVATLVYIAAFHDNQILVICINRFFQMTNDTIITATLMSQFGREGLSGMAYSMMNTFGNFSSVFFCWGAGRYLDHTGESLECWSWIFGTMSMLNVLLLFVYSCCVDSEPIILKEDDSFERGKEIKA